MALDDVILTRAAYRDELRRAFTETAKASLAKVEGGPWDGVPVLTEPVLDETIAAVFDLPVPTPSEHHAEVVTPATITVAALCPRCDLPTTVLLSVHPQLVVDDDGAEIQIKTKTKARSHICNQQELPVGTSDDEKAALDQASFAALLDIGDKPISAEELLDLLSLVKDEFTDDAFPTLEEINGWTEPERELAKAWATATYNLPEDGVAPTLPEVLGGTPAGETPADETDQEGETK